MKPTLGRIVHFRVGTRWVMAFVVDDRGATDDVATMLRIDAPAHVWGTADLGPVFDAFEGCGKGGAYAQLGNARTATTTLFVAKATRGEEIGQWRWPPRES